MSALTLPGTIPYLLQEGSPVVILTGPKRGKGVAVAAMGSVVYVAVVVLGGIVIERYLAEDVALDLTAATGRAHAAWWLADQPGVSWALDCDGHRRWTLHGGEAPRESFHRSFEGVGVATRRMRGGPPEWGWDAEDVPALDRLNPDDDTRLPDGSRWVDAEALRLVCLHVAGVTP